MRNITFSAQEKTIEQARKIATSKHSTLNNMFREWLEALSFQAHEENFSKKLNALWKKTNYLNVGKKLSREEMNKR
jgi:glucan biosynthesis protein